MTQGAVRARIAGLIFVLTWLSAAWFGSWEWNPNNTTRLFATIAIVEDGSARIDRFEAMTIDKARFGDGFYSDKAPGMTLMAVPAVAAVDAVSGERARDRSLSLFDPGSSAFLRLRLRVATATTSAVLLAAGAVAVFLLATGLGAGHAGGAFASIGFALGTPMWGWSTTLFGHGPTTALFAVALWAAWRGTQADGPRTGCAVLLGAALGLAVVVEYSALLTGFPIGAYALWRLSHFSRARAVRALVAAALPALVAAGVLVAYNLFAFGTIFRLGYQGVVGFEGMDQGLFGLTYPKPVILAEILVGTRRGLIWVAPIAAIGLYGLWLLARDATTRALGIAALAGVAMTLLYNASYVYWDGGNSTGPRHLMPAVAYLSLGLGPVWARARAGAGRGMLLLVLALSVALNLVIAASEITSGGPGDFPLWSDVFARFRAGDLRTVMSEWFGWSPFAGLALYGVVALGLSGMLAAALRSPR